jgi:hypothetical protein
MRLVFELCGTKEQKAACYSSSRDIKLNGLQGQLKFWWLSDGRRHFIPSLMEFEGLGVANPDLVDISLGSGLRVPQRPAVAA